jgi:hypothetical protein
VVLGVGGLVDVKDREEIVEESSIRHLHSRHDTKTPIHSTKILILTLFSLSVNFGTGVLHNFTKVQILHPVAGALALVALIWGFVRFLSLFFSYTD